jgi:tRNA G46 methylase TrmB
MSIFHPKSLYIIILKIYHYVNINHPGRTSVLMGIIEKHNFQTFIEVGVWKGENLIPIARKFPKLICYGVDAYNPITYSDQSVMVDGVALYLQDSSDEIFNEILESTRDFSNINIIRASSNSAAELFQDESIDLVFIDANHSFHSVSNDIKCWLPKVKRGGGVIWT